MESVSTLVRTISQEAARAACELAAVSDEKRTSTLGTLADELENQASIILDANAKDVDYAKAESLSDALVDRLTLNRARIISMCAGVREVSSYSDPLGQVLDQRALPSGLLLKKVSVPIGVIALIFESRPNVTIDAASLCLKSGNAVVLRGGKEALHTNKALADVVQAALAKNNMPLAAIQLVGIADREVVRHLAQSAKYINLIIPRGGTALIEAVTEVATVPVIKHYKGLCHIFVDESADIDQAVDICVNAKCQRPGVCNAVETLIVHQNIAPRLLPALVEQLSENAVELVGDRQAREICDKIAEAKERDWDTEYLDRKLSIKTVCNTQEAIAHIGKYGSKHTEAILSKTQSNIDLFTKLVDASAVIVNASTRFNDGSELGLGAEIGISTDKLHARGPMGLRELTTYKYIINGEGQVRA